MFTKLITIYDLYLTDYMEGTLVYRGLTEDEVLDHINNDVFDEYDILPILRGGN